MKLKELIEKPSFYIDKGLNVEQTKSILFCRQMDLYEKSKDNKFTLYEHLTRKDNAPKRVLKNSIREFDNNQFFYIATGFAFKTFVDESISVPLCLVLTGGYVVIKNTFKELLFRPANYKLAKKVFNQVSDATESHRFDFVKNMFGEKYIPLEEMGNRSKKEYIKK